VWIVLALASIHGVAKPAYGQATGKGSIRGIVYGADETTKLPGARVTAINVKTGKPFTSNVTGTNGAYEITGLGEGTYDIVIETGGAVYVADNLVDLAPEQQAALSYAVQPKKPAGRTIEGKPKPKGSASKVGGAGE
jgi:hypothetical protein